MANALQGASSACAFGYSLFAYFITDTPHHDRGRVAELAKLINQIFFMPFVIIEVVAIRYFGDLPTIEALSHEHHTHFITELNELRCRHVVARANSIYTHVLHNLDLSAVRGFIDNSA